MQSLKVAHHLPILIVEDSPADFQTMQRLFRKSGIENTLQHCETGNQALDYLQEAEDDSAFERKPGIILLDLNLPGTDGMEILKRIKKSDSLKTIPVIIFTTSDSEDDITECYRLGANSYITKPVDLTKFREVVDLINSYWLHTVMLPVSRH